MVGPVDTSGRGPAVASRAASAESAPSAPSAAWDGPGDGRGVVTPGPGTHEHDGRARSGLRARTLGWTLLLLSAVTAACGDAAPAADRVHPGALAALTPDLDEATLVAALRLSPLPPPPADPTNRWADDPRAAALGRALFHDVRLSHEGRVSCASCHDRALGYGDGKPLAEGLGTAARHAPSLWNVGHQRWLTWDGSKDSLWAQALVPIELPLEMGGNRVAVARLLHDDPDLRARYEELFGGLPELSDRQRFPAAARPVPEDEPHAHGGRQLAEHAHDVHPQQRAWDAMDPADREAVDAVFARVGKSLAAYERLLVSGEAPFDRFVAGLRSGEAEQLAALGPEARRGLALFVGRGRCVLCHSGPLFSDREFHDVRVPQPDDALAADPGRAGAWARLASDPFVATGRHSDAPDSALAVKLVFSRPELDDGHPEGLGQFRTPSLRNVAESPPYMHQGQLADLDAVLEHYSSLANPRPARGHVERFLQPLQLDAGERADLQAFLESLTGPGPAPALVDGPPAPRAR